jgi:hypothetical protein
MPITISPDIMPSAMAKKPPAHLLQSLLQVSSFHTTTVHPSVYNINTNDSRIAALTCRKNAWHRLSKPYGI